MYLFLVKWVRRYNTQQLHTTYCLCAIIDSILIHTLTSILYLSLQRQKKQALQVSSVEIRKALMLFLYIFMNTTFTFTKYITKKYSSPFQKVILSWTILNYGNFIGTIWQILNNRYLRGTKAKWQGFRIAWTCIHSKLSSPPYWLLFFFCFTLACFFFLQWLTCSLLQLQ